MTERWRFEERVAPAADLHGSWPAVELDPAVRAVARCRPTAPAVVLGSTQTHQVVDPQRAADAGFEVVKRRSGGGAVLVTPDDPVWVDLWVPTGDPLWTTDVTAAFGWLGTAWAGALATVGLQGIEVQGSGPGACTRWASSVCFGGVGAGEVTVDGAKVVGLSQRRNRAGAWFHGACVLHWDPAPLVGVLALDDQERHAAVHGLSAAVIGVTDAAAAQGVTPAPSAASVAVALLDALP